jgi:hypothetical protein
MDLHRSTPSKDTPLDPRDNAKSPGMIGPLVIDPHPGTQSSSSDTNSQDNDQNSRAAPNPFEIILPDEKSDLNVTNKSLIQEHSRVTIAVLFIILLTAGYCILLLGRGSYEKDVENYQMITSVMNIKLPYSLEFIRNQIQIKILDSGIKYLL